MSTFNHSTDVGAILRALEQGMALTRFYKSKKPEKRLFQVKLETRQLIWTRTVSMQVGTRPEGTLDLREVLEVRRGNSSRDFERWQDESKRYDSSKCFVILYGLEFKPKILSVAAADTREFLFWVNGLEYLVNDTKQAAYPFQAERWLRKEFYSMASRNSVVSLKEIKGWLPKINCKMPTNKLRERYMEVDSQVRELNYEGFAILYHNLIHTEEVYNEHFRQFMGSDRNRVTLQDFQQFLYLEQKESWAEKESDVRSHLMSYLEDPLREAAGLHLTKQEFLDYLYSKQNQIWRGSEDNSSQDMNQSLSNYWIASSHNTYLTGDQFSSDSSCEAYAACLRSGCRCIELDCWDGPGDLPLIYHGHTLTSKIKFADVLKTIKDYAFYSSDYPVILSIENHCSIPIQRNMATKFKEVFGDMLLTQLADASETQLPSPNQLKRKVILKHKKLPEGAADGTLGRVDKSAVDDTNFSEGDLSNSMKNGILYLEDPVDKEWNRHFFVLTPTKLHYTEETPASQEDEDDSNGELQENAPMEELHFSEKWFHGRLKGGRPKAEVLLKEYSYLGDGTFLVRESETFVGDYSLSFWRRSRANHCRIKSRQERGQTKYCMIDNLSFESLYSLITHYRQHPLKSQDFQQILTEPVPQPQSHEGKNWFHANLTRQDSEDMLCRIPFDGAYLVRQRPKEMQHDSDSCQFAISFR